MKDKLFNTEEKKAIAIAAFGGLLEHPGWKLFVQVLEENIKLIREQLERGVEGETKEDIDRLRDKLAIFKESINKPVELIEKMQSNEPTIPDEDPFPTVESEAKVKA
jgi:hypothetical protein